MTGIRFDPTDPDFVRDPYPVYAALRRHAPVHWDDRLELWLVSRHADVDAALRDRRLGRVFVPRVPVECFGPWNRVNEHSMLELEPPDHTRLRKLVAHEFTPRRVETMRGHIRQLVADLLDGLPVDGFDLVADLAEPLPVAVIAELLGIPEEDRGLLRPWSNAIVSLYELEPAPDAADRAVQAAKAFTDYLLALIAERRRTPGPDLLSALAGQSLEGDQLTDDELVATAVLLLNAGHEASVNVLGNGMVALLRDRDQQDLLAAQPELVASAVEEMIRYDTPLSLFTRTAFADVDVGGQRIVEGQRLALLLGSANRDEQVFSEADRLRLDRLPNPHVGFGAGIHFCLGAPLARVELQEAVAGLVRRWPGLRLVEEPPLRETFQFRGYRRILVLG